MGKKKLIAALLVLLSVLCVQAAHASTLNIQALIDGRTQLVIQGGDVWWHHFEFAVPGRWDDMNEPTILNGEEWMPVWPSSGQNYNTECTSSVYSGLSPALAAMEQTVSFEIVQARRLVDIIQQPTADNGYTFIIQFFDNWGGAAWYNINISYIGAPVPVPGAVWLFGSGLLGLLGFRKRTPNAR